MDPSSLLRKAGTRPSGTGECLRDPAFLGTFRSHVEPSSRLPTDRPAPGRSSPPALMDATLGCGRPQNVHRNVHSWNFLNLGGLLRNGSAVKGGEAEASTCRRRPLRTGTSPLITMEVVGRDNGPAWDARLLPGDPSLTACWAPAGSGGGHRQVHACVSMHHSFVMGLE